METVAIYCRLSKEDEQIHGTGEQSESIENQRAILTDYALKNEWNIGGIYIDEDYSGADRERPGFCKMIRDCCDGKFNIILCKSLSRFSRELEVIEAYLHGLFPKIGVRFISLSDGSDTKDKSNKKSRQIHSLMNEWYLEDISLNVRTVLDYKRRSGSHIGSFPLYGYRKEKETGDLVIDEPSAEIVREIFKKRADGYSLQEISEELNRQAVPTPSQYKLFYYPSYRGKISPDWTADAVRSILRNEMYTGVLIQGRFRKESFKSKHLLRTNPEEWIRVPEAIPAIVPWGAWSCVNTVKRKCSRKRDPLQEKLRCGICGRRLAKNRQKGREYFRCPCGCSRVLIEKNTLLETLQNNAHRLGLDKVSLSHKEKDETERNALERALELACRNNLSDEIIERLKKDLAACKIAGDQKEIISVDPIDLLDKIELHAEGRKEKQVVFYWKFDESCVPEECRERETV